MVSNLFSIILSIGFVSGFGMAGISLAAGHYSTAVVTACCAAIGLMGLVLGYLRGSSERLDRLGRTVKELQAFKDTRVETQEWALDKVQEYRALASKLPNIGVYSYNEMMMLLLANYTALSGDRGSKFTFESSLRDLLAKPFTVIKETEEKANKTEEGEG
jgi:hypothetical protein